MTLPVCILLVLLVVGAIQPLAYYSQMPEPMATHFGGGGYPNGWSTRVGFFALTLVLEILMAWIFLAAPHLGKRPPKNISSKSQAYWFAPERREQSVRFMKDQFAWFGVVNTILMIATVELVAKANLAPQPILSPLLGWLLIGYFAYTAFWLFRFIKRFKTVPSDAAQH